MSARKTSRTWIVGVMFTAVGVSSAVAQSRLGLGIAADFEIGGDVEASGPTTAGDNQLSCTFHPGLCPDFTTPCSTNDECMGIGSEICTLGLAGDEFAHDNLIGDRSDFRPAPGLEDPSIVAEDFRFLTLGEVTQIEWTGYYRIFNNPGFARCTKADVGNGDRFTVVLLGVTSEGLPDGNNILFQDSQSATPARFVTGVDEGLEFPHDNTGMEQNRERIILRNTYTFPSGQELDILSASLKYLVVVNDTTGTSTNCSWYWRSGPVGNATYYATDDGNFVANWERSNEFADPILCDMSYCFGFNSSGALELPPGVEAEALGAPDNDSLCCDIRVTVQNRSFSTMDPGPLAIDEFYVAINKADGPAGCEAFTDVFPPAGWTASVCENWSNGQLVLRFSGGSLPIQEKVSFIIRTRLNDNESDTVLVEEEISGNVLNEVIQARAIRAWASKDDMLASCGGGADVGPQVGGVGEWGPGGDGSCALVPIPSATTTGKFALAAALIAGGLFLVLRAKAVRVA